MTARAGHRRLQRRVEGAEDGRLGRLASRPLILAVNRVLAPKRDGRCTKGGTAGGRKHLLSSSLGKSPHREVIQQQLSALHPSTLNIARGSNNQSE